MKIKGTNKQKGTRRTWGSGYWIRGTLYRPLYKGNKQKGTRMMKLHQKLDGEWYAVGRWQKCD